MRLRDLVPGYRATPTGFEAFADLGWCRFIPNRSGQDFPASFSLLHEDGSPATPSKSAKRTPHNELHFQKSTCIIHPNKTVNLTLIALQLKKPIGHTRVYSALRCSMIVFLKASPSMRVPLTMTPHGPKHHRDARHCLLLVSHRQPHTRTSSLTCPLAMPAPRGIPPRTRPRTVMGQT